jgi:ATP-binding cassette subfamily B protein
MSEENSEQKKRGQIDRDSLGSLTDKELLKRLLSYLKPYWGWLLLALTMLPLASAASLLQPQLIQTSIDDFFVPGNLEGFGLIALAYLGTVIGEYVVKFTQMYATQVAGQQGLRDLRMAVFEHLQRLKTSYFQRNPIGRLLSRLTTDIDSLQDALSSGVVTIIGDLLTLTGIVVILLLKDWRLALVTFSVVPILLGLTILFRRLLRHAYRRARLLIARLNAYLQESVTGMAIIQLFTHEKRSRREYAEINEDYRNAALGHVRWDAILYAVVEMISSIAIALIIWYGAGQAIQDLVTIGVLVAFIEYAQKFFVPIRDLSQKYATIQSAMASAERIFQILEKDEIIEEDDDALPIKELKDSIEFRNVWFAYNDDNWILRDVSFTIKKCEKIALVGHTGAGKSTINRLLTRLWDIQKGQILIDGVDIRRYRVDDLRRLFAVVLQDVFLFSGDIERNITLDHKDISRSDVQHACEVVGLDEMLERVSGGIHHEVRERGNNLSAGERQLVAFARALAHRPEILILDEATANVDTETESHIQQAVERMLSHQTSIVVAHRLSTIQNVDRIYVMHHGEVVEVGDHDELMSKQGIYAKLVKLNYSSVTPAAE